MKYAIVGTVIGCDQLEIEQILTVDGKADEFELIDEAIRLYMCSMDHNYESYKNKKFTITEIK